MGRVSADTINVNHVLTKYFFCGVGDGLGRPYKGVQTYAQKLRDEWYETSDSLREISAEEDARLTMPSRG